MHNWVSECGKDSTVNGMDAVMVMLPHFDSYRDWCKYGKILFMEAFHRVGGLSLFGGFIEKHRWVDEVRSACRANYHGEKHLELGQVQDILERALSGLRSPGHSCQSSEVEVNPSEETPE